MGRSWWPFNRATKGIGSLIGLATKAHAHHKEKAAEKENANTENVATNETSHDTSYEDNEPDEEPDEEDWALDDASTELSADRPNEDVTTSLKAPVSMVFKVGMVPASMKPLPCPVILPQRRPQSKSRGFVRAYAPLLDEVENARE